VIRFSAILVAGAIVVLVTGVLATSLTLVYLSIGSASSPRCCWRSGSALRRREIFGEADAPSGGHQPGWSAPSGAGAPAMAGGQAGIPRPGPWPPDAQTGFANGSYEAMAAWNVAAGAARHSRTTQMPRRSARRGLSGATTGRGRTTRRKTAQVKTAPAKTGPARTGQARTGQARTGQEEATGRETIPGRRPPEGRVDPDRQHQRLRRGAQSRFGTTRDRAAGSARVSPAARGHGTEGCQAAGGQRPRRGRFLRRTPGRTARPASDRDRAVRAQRQRRRPAQGSRQWSGRAAGCGQGTARAGRFRRPSREPDDGWGPTVPGAPPPAWPQSPGGRAGCGQGPARTGGFPVAVTQAGRWVGVDPARDAGLARSVSWAARGREGRAGTGGFPAAVS
jgi:hypothetical protein